MSCNNYTATQIPLSVGFDANGNAGSLVETKEIKVTKIETPTDSDQLIIAAGTEVVFKGNVTVEGTINVGAVEAASSLSSLTDVTITSVANGEVLVWSSNDWINRTLAEAGILGTTDLANYATNTYVSSNYATSNSLSAYAPSSWVNSNFLANSTIGTTVQGYDPVLEALSLATVTANTVAYFNTGAAATTTTLTPFARTDLLAATGAAPIRASLDLEPGVDIQVQNTSLQDIANIDTVFLTENDVLAWDGANWVAVAAPGGGPVALNDITDVTIATAVANDFLVYDSGQWRDQAPSVARTSLGATTVGANIFTLNNPTAVTYLKINNDNSVSTRTAVEMQSDLSVTPGTNVQTQNANLQSIANQTTTENTLIYFSGSTSAATTTLTSFGRSLLDDANATECRGTLSAQLSSVPLDNLTNLCTGAGSTGASAFGRLFFTVTNGLSPGINILPVDLYDPTNISNSYGKILRFEESAIPGYGLPKWNNLFLGELANVDITGAGGNLTAGRILYVNTSQDLTELANPAGTSFLRHDGANTGPTWRSSADVRTDIGLATTDSPQFAGVNVGNAADTLIARSSAGNITVAGQTIYRAGGTDVPILDGGTGASTAAGARTNIFAGLSIAKGDLITYDGSDFARIPAPTIDGAYLLRVVKSGSTFTFSWQPESNYSN